MSNFILCDQCSTNEVPIYIAKDRLDTHKKFDCHFNINKTPSDFLLCDQCSTNEVSIYILKDRLDIHKKFDCPFVLCDQCSTYNYPIYISRDKLNIHKNLYCPQGTVDCCLAFYGCREGFDLKRWQLVQHENEYLKRHHKISCDFLAFQTNDKVLKNNYTKNSMNVNNAVLLPWMDPIWTPPKPVKSNHKIYNFTQSIFY